VATVCNKTTFVFEAGEQPNLAKIQDWKTLGDASESALVKFCHPLRDIVEFRSTLKQVAAIPFNSNNKWQLSIHEDRDKACNVILMKGAPEKIAALCEHVWLNGQKVPVNVQEIEDRNLELGGRGERVLAFAELELPTDKYPLGFAFDTESKSPNFPISGLTFCGLVSLIDPPRPGVPDAVLTCQEAGIKVIMVTGDHPVTARAIARSVNIMPGKTAEEVAKERGVAVETILNDPVEKEKIECVVTPGHLLPQLSDEDWRYILSRKYIVFARTLPQQKQDIVGHLQSELGGHHLVAVTGDGVNDSPALKKADTGIAMGIAGSDVAKEAADIILMDDNFASIVKVRVPRVRVRRIVPLTLTAARCRASPRAASSSTICRSASATCSPQTCPRSCPSSCSSPSKSLSPSKSFKSWPWTWAPTSCLPFAWRTSHKPFPQCYFVTI
jgi:sodium/potassium-transporting ATPase subunit alpha